MCVVFFFMMRALECIFPRAAGSPPPDLMYSQGYAPLLMFHKATITLWHTFSETGFMGPTGSYVAFDCLPLIDLHSDTDGRPLLPGCQPSGLGKTKELFTWSLQKKK